MSRIVDLLKKEFPPSSLERLRALPPNSWSPALFHKRASDLGEERGLQVLFYPAAGKIPMTGATGFAGCHWLASFRSGEIGENEFLAAVELPDIGTVGFAACTYGSITTIEWLEVADDYTVSAGYRQQLQVSGETFSVGMGHLIAKRVTDHLSTPIRVDASTSRSEFIFRSLGFVDMTLAEKAESGCFLILRR